MNGHILLAGGAEFGGQMAAADRAAIALAGGIDAAVVIIPTAAAPDNNHRRAGGNGERWFRSLGATNVSVAALTDRRSADDTAVAATLRGAQLIYLLGGFTHYLGQTLRGSRSAAALAAAHAAGAVIAGSSAGAMVMCEHYYNPSDQRIHPGLNLVPNACVLPHHNTFGKRWAAGVARLLPGAALLGIDERTGMLNDGANGGWRVLGGGGVTVYQNGQVVAYDSAETIPPTFT